MFTLILIKTVPKCLVSKKTIGNDSWFLFIIYDSFDKQFFYQAGNRTLEEKILQVSNTCYFIPLEEILYPPIDQLPYSHHLLAVWYIDILRRIYMCIPSCSWKVHPPTTNVPICTQLNPFHTTISFVFLLISSYVCGENMVLDELKIF